MDRFYAGHIRTVDETFEERMMGMADTRWLPRPVAETYDWQLQGACRGMDSPFFFHPENERGAARANREARAKEVCRTCPVIEPCRRHALAAHEPYGVWGGLSESERNEILRGHARPLRVTERSRTLDAT